MKARNASAVRLLLPYKAPVFLLRDQKGRIPFHIAVNAYTHVLVQLLGDAGPDEALTTEDGVGNTPLEIVVSHWLQRATGGDWAGELPRAEELNDQIHHTQQRRRYPSEDEARALSAAVARLLAPGGPLRAGTRLANALTAFAERTQVAVANAERDPVDEVVEDKEPEFSERSAESDTEKTMDCLISALARRPALRRQLVHLADVHRSVQGSLDRSTKKPPQPVWHTYRRQRDDEGGLDPEEVVDKEQKEKERSAIHRYAPNFDLFGDDPHN